MTGDSENHFSEFAEKMRNASANDAATKAFHHSYDRLLAGDSGLIQENEIERVESLPTLQDHKESLNAADLLSQTLIIKLNGGLGTSMGLERAKSLLEVKEDQTFLDLIARQVIHLRKEHGVRLRFMLMNSFNTSADTLKHLEKYPELGPAKEIELVQNQVPKVDARTMRPIEWPSNRQLEWCPPGHGDIYPCLLGSGWLARLLNEGVKYAFVSNSDNLGATLELRLLQYFAKTGQPFLMEVAERTEMDRKGGHLARKNGRFLLRESAQCPDTDMPAFQDIKRHRFFNTNNLWIRLDRLAQVLEKFDGLIPLPLIKNKKTVDPRDKHSPEVVQLETAMGAAIQAFPDSGAIVVPRDRFVPVKTTSDLLVLRSDAYRLNGDGRITATVSNLAPPTVELDSQHYKLVEDLDKRFPEGVPSLRNCRRLTVKGLVQFRKNTQFEGEVKIENPSTSLRELPSGNYKDSAVTL